MWPERKKGQSSIALPISQRSAQKGLSERTRKLASLEPAALVGSQSLSLRPEWSPHSFVWHHKEQMLCRIGSGFTFLGEQRVSAGGQETEDREDPIDIHCLRNLQTYL